mmetsp:Transcript_28215/g.71622  ORF Transcript_28215/g.71622 Transcript_28215/m.71622 type:complete len:235 (-) Transcript_28215:524-1228(-)
MSSPGAIFRARRSARFVRASSSWCSSCSCSAAPRSFMNFLWYFLCCSSSFKACWSLISSMLGKFGATNLPSPAPDDLCSSLRGRLKNMNVTKVARSRPERNKPSSTPSRNTVLLVAPSLINGVAAAASGHEDISCSSPVLVDAAVVSCSSSSAPGSSLSDASVPVLVVAVEVAKAESSLLKLSISPPRESTTAQSESKPTTVICLVRSSACARRMASATTPAVTVLPTAASTVW